jgi:hypothetical protein
MRGEGRADGPLGPQPTRDPGYSLRPIISALVEFKFFPKISALLVFESTFDAQQQDIVSNSYGTAWRPHFID